MKCPKANRFRVKSKIFVKLLGIFVLLLVLQAELNKLQSFVGRAGEKPRHRVIDMGAIGGDAGHLRPGQQPAHRPRMAGADGLIVRIEQETKILVEHLVIFARGTQDELFEKPCHVRAMPLRRARVGHGLNALVLGRQRRGERFGVRADRFVLARQIRHRHGAPV